MAKERDSLEALASASARKSSGSYRQQLQRQQLERRRQFRNRLVAGALVLVIGAGAVWLVTRLVQAPPTPPLGLPSRELLSVVGFRGRRQELESAWSLAKGRELTPAYKPLIEKGGAHALAIRSLWAEGRYEDAAEEMEGLRIAIQGIERVDRSREAALAARQDAAAMAQDAQGSEAEQLVPAFWAEAQRAYATAGERFEGDEFEAASEGWRDAAEAYGRAALAADQARAVGDARKSLDARLVKRFDTLTLEQHAGAELRELSAVVAAAEKDFAEHRFEEARQKLEEAHAMVPRVELAIRRQIGAHYHAVLAGYRASDLLLLRSIGETPGEGSWTALRQTLENLLLSPEVIDRLTGSREADYLPLAKALLDETSAAIASRWGPAVEASFAVGVQVRLIEQLLNTEADAFASQESTEVRRSIAAIQRHAEVAGYPPAVSESLKQLTASLAIRPEYEAIRRSRQVWTELTRKLEDFDEAMKLLPMSGQ